MMDWRAFFNEHAATGDAVLAGVYINAGKRVSDESLDLTARDIAAKMNLQAHHNLADICCGGGLMLDRLHPLVARVTGADFALESLKICRRAGHHVAATDAAALPFPDAAFDRVLCHCTCMCMTSQAQTTAIMDELLRITKRGGILLAGDVPDYDVRDGYWHYTSQAPLPRAWRARVALRRLRDAAGIVPKGVTGQWDGSGTSHAMFTGSWFARWARDARFPVKVEILRHRIYPSGRGTDPFRFDVRITRKD